MKPEGLLWLVGLFIVFILITGTNSTNERCSRSKSAIASATSNYDIWQGLKQPSQSEYQDCTEAQREPGINDLDCAQYLPRK
jgi:hypothetical protein